MNTTSTTWMPKPRHPEVKCKTVGCTRTASSRGFCQPCYKKDYKERRKAHPERKRRPGSSTAGPEAVGGNPGGRLYDLDGALRLLPLSVFSDSKNENPREALNWLYDNMLVEDVDPGTAPSSGIYAHLMFLRGNPAAMAEFYKAVWPKLLPTAKQMEQESRFRAMDENDTAMIQDLIDLRKRLGLST